MDFGNLESLNVAGKTAKMYIEELGEDAFLELAIADESNEVWYNAILERSAKIATERAMSKRRRKQKDDDDLDPEQLLEARVRDAKLLPKCVIVGWSGISNKNGPVDFSVEAADALVQQLLKSCPRIVDEIRGFAQTPANFMDEDDEVDTEALVEN